MMGLRLCAIKIRLDSAKIKTQNLKKSQNLARFCGIDF